jgi:hypothetical protein
MLRRSVPFRRMLAVALAGVALGACSSTKDATAPSTQAGGDLTSGTTLEFSLSASTVFFNYAEGSWNTPSQTVDISGVIVTAVPWAKLGSIQYQPSNIKNWVTVTQRATVLADRTLGVRLTITPHFVPGVDLGATAVIPVTIPGSTNSPQFITVTTNALNCPIAATIPYPTPTGAASYVNGDSQPTDCTSSYFPDYWEGYHYFDLYAVTVPAGHSFRLDMFGSPSGYGTLTDPWLYLFDPASMSILAVDDDSGVGFESLINWTNTSSQDKVYYLIASQYYPPSEYGTYRLQVTDLGVGASAASLSVKAYPLTAGELEKKAHPRQAPR